MMGMELSEYSLDRAVCENGSNLVFFDICVQLFATWKLKLSRINSFTDIIIRMVRILIPDTREALECTFALSL